MSAWNKTPAGRAYYKKWAKENKEKVLRNKRKYNSSKKGSDAQIRWRNSPQGQAYLKSEKRKAWAKSPTGKESLRRAALKQRLKSPIKTNARSLARIHNKNKKPCSKCGSIRTVQKHHPDYKKPRKIVWLCTKCHWNIHQYDT